MKAGVIAGLCGLALLAAIAAPAAAAGHRSPTAKASVIAGVQADPAKWSFVAALLYRGRLICTASVISPTRVLTAAHCAKGLDPGLMSVLTGRTRIGDGGVGQVIPVTAASVDPGFSFLGLHDVAVLSLGQPTTAPPIALASAADDAATTAPGGALATAGYGQRNPLAFGHPHIGVLTSISERVQTSCQRVFGARFSSQSAVCALGRRVRHVPISRSTCFGDSGGPLVATTAAGLRLVGVTSTGAQSGKGVGRFVACGFRRLPDIFARVADNLDFIQSSL